LVVSCVFIYSWDQYRLLRVVQRSFYGSGIQDRAALDMLCFPCGMLLACVVYRTYGLENNHFMHHVPDPVRPDMSRYSVWFCMFVVFVIHCVLHIWVVNALPKLLVKEEKLSGGENDGRPYRHTAASDPCNWFNSNPIHCLRTKYIWEKDGDHWCVPYRLGREYLQREEPQLAQFYIQPDFAPDDTVVQGALDGLRKLSSTIMDKADHMLHRRPSTSSVGSSGPPGSPKKSPDSPKKSPDSPKKS